MLSTKGKISSSNWDQKTVNMFISALMLDGNWQTAVFFFFFKLLHRLHFTALEVAVWTCCAIYLCRVEIVLMSVLDIMASEMIGNRLQSACDF